jgi:uncharacterized membrane protein
MDSTHTRPETPSQAVLFSEERFKQFLDGFHRFPHFKHESHRAIIDVNKASDDTLTLGQKIADSVASGMGSWGFILIQTSLLATWITLNLLAWVHHWDPYPFIFLNLALSFQAAYAAPFIMMSQNRQSAKDRLAAESDYHTNVKGEQEICHMMDHLDHQDELTREILLRLEVQNKYIEAQEKLILEIVTVLHEQHQGFADQYQEILERLNMLEK